MSAFKTLTNGLWRENPVFILMLGMCPTLAVSSSAKNALGMGLATTFVLAGSNLVISLCRKWIPDKVRIPCYIVIIATFVTVVEQLMKAYAPPELNRTWESISADRRQLHRLDALKPLHQKNVSLRRYSMVESGAGFTLALMSWAQCVIHPDEPSSSWQSSRTAGIHLLKPRRAHYRARLLPGSDQSKQKSQVPPNGMKMTPEN